MKPLLLSLLLGVGGAFAQPQKPSRRIELRVERVLPRPPAEPEAGDKLQVDPATGDLLVEYETRDGELVSGRIEVATNVKPEVTATFELVRPGLVRYIYELKNGREAKQPIGLFAVAMSDPELISNIQAPSGWWTPGSSRGGTPTRYNWAADYLMWLQPGTESGPFSFESPHLPGLTHLYIQARVQSGQSEQVVPRHGMSEWMRVQIISKDPL